MRQLLPVTMVLYRVVVSVCCAARLLLLLCVVVLVLVASCMVLVAYCVLPLLALQRLAPSSGNRPPARCRRRGCHGHLCRCHLLRRRRHTQLLPLTRRRPPCLPLPCRYHLHCRRRQRCHRPHLGSMLVLPVVVLLP